MIVACYYWREREVRCIERAVMFVGCTPETIGPDNGLAFCALHGSQIIRGIEAQERRRFPASEVIQRLGGFYWRSEAEQEQR